MRSLLAAGPVLLVLALAPSAHALSATLTSPSDGATYYTGSQFTAPVPWSGTFEFSPCSGNNFFIGQVQRWGGPSAPPAGHWPSNGGTKEGALSGTNNLSPGDYHYKAAAECGFDTVFSAAVTIHVVAGNPPTISDRDLDGVSDSNDQCPDIPGSTSNSGCPVFDPPVPAPTPEGGGDKVPDSKDECDDEAGPAWNEGCAVSVPAAPKRRPELRARASTTCTLAKLRSEGKRRAPAMKGGAQVAKLKRCYAKNVPGVPDGWPLISFWANAKFKPGFDVFPPELRPQNAPPITRATLKARPGFNVYTVKKQTSRAAIGLPVFSILTSETTPTNTGGRLQVGVIFPPRGSLAYKRVAL